MFPTTIRTIGGLVAVLGAPAIAAAYIHFPPKTLPKMCKDSQHIRVLRVVKFDRDKGVIVFESSESLKGEKSRVTSLRHGVGTDTPGAKTVLDWAGVGKLAVAFWIESPADGAIKAIGYVFTDDGCYTVDYNARGEYWAVIRSEPGLTACYHGRVDKLVGLIRDILAGKEVTVPTREPAPKEDRDRRNKDVNDALGKNRPVIK
jgi:hypothetical protein